MKQSLSTEKGAVLIEYAIAIGLLVVIFAAAGAYLLSATKNRAAISIDSVSGDIPCIDPLLFPPSEGFPENKLNKAAGECN